MVSLMIQQRQTNKANTWVRGLSQSEGYTDTKWDEGSQHLFVEIKQRETPMRMRTHFKVTAQCSRNKPAYVIGQA